jgi:hypothetical protein
MEYSIVDRINEQDLIDDCNKRNEASAQINDTAKSEFYGADATVPLEGRVAEYYEGEKAIVEQVRLEDVTHFICDRIRESVHDGTVAKTIKRYTDQLKNYTTPEKHLELRRVAERVWSDRYDDAAVERGRREYVDLIGSLRIQRRGEQNGK